MPFCGWHLDRRALQESSDIAAVQQKVQQALTEVQANTVACQQRIIDLEHQQRHANMPYCIQHAVDKNPASPTAFPLIHTADPTD